MLNGTKLEKLTSNWMLTTRREPILHSINQIPVIIPLCVRRKANHLANRLANERVNNEPQDLEGNSENMTSNNLKEDCMHIQKSDMAFPYRVLGEQSKSLIQWRTPSR